MAVMTGQKLQCAVCGNEVVVSKAGKGEIVCCGKPMKMIADGFSCEKGIPTGTD